MRDNNTGKNHGKIKTERCKIAKKHWLSSVCQRKAVLLIYAVLIKESDKYLLICRTAYRCFQTLSPTSQAC